MAEKKEPDIKVLTTERPEGPENKSTLRTPSGEANVEVITMTWYSQVGVRVLRTYLQGISGFLLAGMTGATAGVVGALTDVQLPAMDFFMQLKLAASLAVGPAMMTLIHNAIELLGKWDVSSPQMRA